MSSKELGEKQKWGYFESILSFVLNIILFFLKLWAGIATGSIAMIADAWHTLSDCLSSFVVFFGVWMGAKPADEGHPYGHGRAELIGAVVISFILFIVGLEFFIDSLKKFKLHEHAHYTWFAISIFIISIIVKEVMAQFSIWAGKHVESQALIADGWHHRSDAVTTIIVVIGAFIAPFAWWMDSAMGVVVSLVIIYTAIEVFRDCVKPILGEEPSKEVVDKIERISFEISPLFSRLHHIHYHRYGDHKEMTFHIDLPGNMSLDESHKLLDILEKRIFSELEIHSTGHMEPNKKLP
ncbi:MAG: cation diffusion facilitator family transporter [Fusobacteria bacterium]|nr:cation diffusion facilitator family transporter [Fusobacteriota bacterium]